MKCPTCRREMTVLLFSCVCDYCEGSRAPETPFVGYVVWSDAFKLPTNAYVFAEAAFAERWRSMRGPRDGRVRRVTSTHPFRWRTGVQSTRDLIFADSLVEVHENHRFEPGPHRAVLH